MIDSRGWHPVLRYGLILVLGSAALALCAVSWLCNPHSVPWLLSIFTATGLLLIALRTARKSSLHRSYALYLAMVCQYLLCVWLLHVLVPSGRPEAVKKIAAYWAWFFYPGLIFNAQAHFHFALRFAEVRSRFMLWLERICWGISIYFLALNCLNLFVLDYVWAGFTWVPTLAGGYGHFFPFTTFLLSMGLAVPLYKAITSRGHQRRLQLTYYVLGAAPVWICCWGNFLISWGLNIYPAGGVMFLLHVALIGYAVLMHRVFDFTIVVRRGLAYAAVSMVLGLIYGTLLWAGAAWKFSDLHTSGILPSILFVFAAGVAYSPLLSYFQRIVDRFFFRHRTERQQLLEQFARETAATVQLASVAESLCRILDQSFKPRRTALYLHDDQGHPILYGSYDATFSAAPWPNGEPLPAEIGALLKQSARASRLTRPNSPHAAGTVHFSEDDEALVVPVMHRQEALGCMVLEPKKADEPYDDEDVQLAETIAAHSSTALLNARSFARLEQLQALSRRTLEELTVGVVVISAAGRILQANRMARQFFPAESGRSPGTIEEFWALQPVLGQQIRRAVQGRTIVTNKDVRIDGERPRNFLMSVFDLEHDKAELLYLVIFYDISDYKELEASARKREALARVGEAISSINHEIGNVIQPIRYQVDQLAELETNDRVLKRVIKIVPDRLAALERLLSNLRDLSRPIELRKRRVEIAELAESVCQDLDKNTMPAAIHWERSISGEARYCVADGHWLRQVLFNLVKNSVEATSGCETPRIAVRTRRDGGHLHIDVEDNGCGIDVAARRKLFEPFFSTKGESGTGLGLSVSRRIIELHGGSIDVFSEAGKGSRFQITLPWIEALADTPQPAPVH